MSAPVTISDGRDARDEVLFSCTGSGVRLLQNLNPDSERSEVFGLYSP